MRVISKSRLRNFWESPNCADSQGSLQAWYTHVNSKSVAWENWGEVRASFSHADLVGNCVVFNIGGNKFRLITRILFPSQKVFILRVMTHKQYDKENWKTECGCFSARPNKGRKNSLSKTVVKKRKA